MKIKPILCSVILCAVLVSAEASFAGGLFQRGYVGASAGVTIHEGASQLYDEWVDSFDEDTYYADASFEDQGVGFQFFAGIAISNSVSLELFYADFGEFEYSEFTSGTPEQYKLVGSTSGVGFALRYDIPVTPVVDVYARLGLYKWETELEGTDVWIEDDALVEASYSDEIDAVDPFMGFGVSYKLGSSVQLFGELNYSNAQYVSLNNSVYGLFFGLSYQFGESRRNVDTISTQPMRSTSVEDSESQYRSGSRKGSTACDPKYKDISGVMCE